MFRSRPWRNRVYSPALGRFMQRDPNATALALLSIQARHGQGSFGGISDFDLEGMYGDGLNLYAYLGSNPMMRHDPLGLSWDPFDIVDDYLATDLGNKLATLSAIGQGAKAGAVLAATIASYMPFPLVSASGESALWALGESSDSEYAMSMALTLVPGGKIAGKLGPLLAKGSGHMWQTAMHLSRYTPGGLFINKAGGLMKKAREALRRKPSGACGCFIAGTLVWTAHGMVPIEQVQVGDFVLAKDEQTGELVLRMVTSEIVNKQTALLDVTLDQEGREILLRTTDEHPFWVEGQGWKRADSLEPGQSVQTLGGTGTVLALSFTGERTTVYNISVAGDPNYFVGPDGVWVHNCETFKSFQSGGSAAHGEIIGRVARFEFGYLDRAADVRGLGPQMKKWARKNGAVAGMLDTGPIDPRNAQSIIDSLSRHADSGTKYFGGQVTRTGLNTFHINWTTLP